MCRSAIRSVVGPTVIMLCALASAAAAQYEWKPGFQWPGGNGLPGQPYALAVFDDGTGPALYVGGEFHQVGDVVANNIAKWDGTRWTGDPGLGGGTNGAVQAFAVFDDGTGPGLYAAGTFTQVGGVAANRIAKWDGAIWTPLGTGVSPSSVPALAVFDDGTGPALYAGGNFVQAGGVPARSIAKWNGAAWAPVGVEMHNDCTVFALAVFDDGTGPALYAGGTFTNPYSGPGDYIAKWDGATWTPLGTGMDYVVYALAVFDDGTGPALYVGGSFTHAGDVSANRIAKWDGSAWAPLGSGMDGGSLPWVFALTVLDECSGLCPALYAGGWFTEAGGAVGTNAIAKWDGATWASVGGGIYNTVLALTVFDNGTGPALYAVGNIGTAGGISSLGIAKWAPQ
jgi:hypothetical protein